MSSRQKIGYEAEQEARRYLESNGLKFVASNFSSKPGEIDLIMRDEAELVFIEVRYRDSQDYGGGLESITYRKQQRIARTALAYLQKHDLVDEVPCRFDVVALGRSDIGNEINWIKAAFLG